MTFALGVVVGMVIGAVVLYGLVCWIALRTFLK